MQVQSLDDHQLIDTYLAGDEAAFSTLLHRHKAKIYSSIYMFTKDRELADDLFQDVFIKIIDTLRKGKYNHEGKFLQWALRISYNMCVDQFRRSKRRTKVSATETFDIFDVLRHYADMSFKEIACLTDVSINTALGRMRYALINIRKLVEEKQLVI